MAELIQPFNDPQADAVFFGIFTVILLIGSFLSGWCMKLACRIAGGGEIGIFRALATVGAGTVASTAAALIVQYSDPDGSPWKPVLWGLAAGIGAIAVLLKQNPLRALFTYALYSLMGTIVFGGGAIVLAVAAMYFVPEENLEQLVEHVERVQTTQGRVIQGRPWEEPRPVSAGDLDSVFFSDGEKPETERAKEPVDVPAVVTPPAKVRDRSIKKNPFVVD